jgi:hypothetical protein
MYVCTCMYVCMYVWILSLKSGFWTGRKVICSYQLILTALMGCELYLLGVALRTVQQFQAVRNLQHHTTTLTTYPAYVGSQETIIASLFNELFFSAVHVCGEKRFRYTIYIHTHCIYDTLLHIHVHTCIHTYIQISYIRNTYIHTYIHTYIQCQCITLIQMKSL